MFDSLNWLKVSIWTRTIDIYIQTYLMKSESAQLVRCLTRLVEIRHQNKVLIVELFNERVCHHNKPFYALYAMDNGDEPWLAKTPLSIAKCSTGIVGHAHCQQIVERFPMHPGVA